MNEYEVSPIRDGIYLVFEPEEDVCMYLVIGTKKAALIDSGMGTGDLPALVKSLTDLPVLPLLTHAHNDHFLGMLTYPKIYLAAADFEIFVKYATMELEEQQAQQAEALPQAEASTMQTWSDGEVIAAPSIVCQLPTMETLHVPEVIDLGGRTLETVSLCGHTEGSIGFFLPEEKILFSGDGLTYHVWMHLPESTSLERYLQTLEDLKRDDLDFEEIYTGHSRTPFGKNHLQKVMQLVKKVIASPATAGHPNNDVDFPGMSAEGDGCWISYPFPNPESDF